MIVCTVCNAPNRTEARFCGNCRIPLNVCPQCSTANRAGASFCRGCSQRLKVSCSFCGAMNRFKASYCRNCGRSFTTARPALHPQPTIRCLACGQQNRPTATYCSICGGSLAVQPVSTIPHPRHGTGGLLQSIVLRQRYKVLDRIAQGGQGAVYKVSDTRLTGKLWALKEMSQSGIVPGERQNVLDSFYREAELLANLDHINLPKVVDVFEEQGRHYMVMEFVDGKTFQKILEESSGPISLDRVLDWAEQLCDVLDYLHNQSKPIIYRDLKPQNIMEVAGGHDIKLIDFGIVRFYKVGKSTDTVTLGTPGFAPPEQYGTQQTDVRADIYALGATLHCLLTCRDPSTKLFHFPSVRSLNKSVPRDVDDAITKAVSSEKKDRFASMEEMGLALLKQRNWQVPTRSKPIPVSPPPMPAPPSPGVRPGPVSIPPPFSVPPTPLHQAGLTVTERLLDYGTLEKGNSDSLKLHLVLAPGSTGRIHSLEPWIRLSPLTLQSGTTDVDVTICTDALELKPEATARSMPNWLGATRRWLKQQSRKGLGGIITLLLLSPLWLVAAVGSLLIQALLWVVYWHARRMVPVPREHHGQVEIETSAGDEGVEVRVKVHPKKRHLIVGWTKVAVVMLFEIALVAVPVAGLISGVLD